MNIVWTRNALDDLQDIRSYLKRSESPEYAKKVTQEIVDEVTSLKEWNNKGSFVPELEDLHLTTHRQLLAGQYRIIIERGQDTVHVHMIAHTRRDLEALIRRRLFNA